MFRSLSACIGIPLLVGCIAAVTAIPARATVVTGESDAHGADISLTVAGLITGSIGPIAPSSGTAPAPYNDTDQFIGAVGTGNVPLVGEAANFSAGLLETTAFSDVDGVSAMGTANAETLINDLNTTVGDLILLGDPLLAVTASTVNVISDVTGQVGSLETTGSVFVEDLQITVLGTVLDVSAAITDGFIAPNTTIALDAAGLVGAELVLNQQIVTGDGVFDAGIETNFLALNLDAVTLDPLPGLLSTDVVIGHTAAALTAVPEPSSLLLLSCGLAGAFLCRRRNKHQAEPATVA